MAKKFNILSSSGTGKGLGIFNAAKYKEHERTAIARYFWTLRWDIGVWLICALAFGLSFAVEHVWRYGWSPASQTWVYIYLKNLLFTCGLSGIAEIPFWLSRTLLHPDIACITPILPIIAYYFLADTTLTDELNPNGKKNYEEKSSRKATADDIKKMGRGDNPDGLFKGFMMVLGYFKNKGKQMPLMMDECLSALCLAPPGTGKTFGVVMPTILDCDNVSMIINDPKPELLYSTSGYRSTVGPVFVMNWAGQDDPEHGIYYPSWNPLSPEHVPFDKAQRDLYVDSICKVLVEDPGSSTADPHWTNTARAALSGYVHFIISKVERAKADDHFYNRIREGKLTDEERELLSGYYLSMMNDSNAYAANAMLLHNELNATNYVHIGTWANIPDAWHGKEASFPMVLDWITASQNAISEEIEKRRREGDSMAMMADPMHDLLLHAVDEAIRFAYNPRAISELTQLANTPDRERGSIISTMSEGLKAFKNSAVRNRTSHSDFHFDDLRGLRDPRDGKIKPVSVYLSVNLVDAKAVNPISAIFIQLMSDYLLAHKPDQIIDGKRLGPYPVLFVLDEMPKMQKLDAVIEGPDVGRGQKVSYLIIGQDIHQIQKIYGADAASTIISTTAAKIVLRQNDPDTAKTFSSMIGMEKTKKVETKDGKKVETPETKPLYSEMDIMKIDFGKQIVLFQGYYDRPIEAEAVLYWKNKTPNEQRLYAKIQMGESSPLPEFLIPSHHAIMGYEGTPKIYNPNTKEIKILEPLK